MNQNTRISKIMSPTINQVLVFIVPIKMQNNKYCNQIKINFFPVRINISNYF